MTVVHNLIAETAKSIAREAYESIAHDNAFYAEWPDRELFVAANFQMFVQDARAALMKILTGDYPQAMKDPVYEAFLKDGLMKRDPNAPAPNRAARRAHRVLN